MIHLVASSSDVFSSIGRGSGDGILINSTPVLLGVLMVNRKATFSYTFFFMPTELRHRTLAAYREAKVQQITLMSRPLPDPEATVPLFSGALVFFPC